MADDTSGDDAVDPSIRDRQRAEGAAGDLARMGIDPRSLGLGDVAPPLPAAGDPVDDQAGARVVQLRPGLAQPLQPAPVPEPPVHDEGPAVAPPAPTTTPPPRQASRLLRTVAKGLVTPDAAVSIQGEREAIDAVRQRQTDRRVIAFIAGKGGVGCTTVAVGAGTAFMALREDHSVVVDVQQGTASLGGTFGADRPRSIASLTAEVEATSPPVAASGLGLVDGSDWDQTLGRADVVGVLDRLRADHTFNLLDVGDDAGEAGHAALARADQVVVVTGPGELGRAALGTAVDRAKAVNPVAASVAVHVVVCPHEQSYREAQRQLGPQGGVVVVPPDPWLQAGHPYDPAAVSPETREALLRVSGLVALRGVRR
jgi:MinD-like ATPase involved in chromosome partitioning or flagellar assembly